MNRLRRIVIALALLAAVGLPISVAGGWASPSSGTGATTGGAFRLYVLDQDRGVRLLPVDATRLSSIRHGRAISIGKFNPDGSPPQVLQSDDGRTLAAYWITTRTVRVYNARTGAVRAAFQLPMGVVPQGLSRDGTKLLGTTSDSKYTVSTTGGRLLSKIQLACCSPTAFDTVRARLFVLEVSEPQDPTAKPGSPHLVAYDLGSGRRITSMPLDGIADGMWQTGTLPSGEPKYVSWTPAFAISPNGKQIAVFDGISDRLTFVDAQRMKIDRVVTVSRPQSFGARLVQWLGLVPEVAEAKGPTYGGTFELRYSPDGRLLYLTGSVYVPGSNARSIGIQSIDVATGKITGETLEGHMLWWTQPAPDGSALYALNPPNNDAQICLCVLRRLDPRTLVTLAKQYSTRYANPQYFVLVAPKS